MRLDHVHWTPPAPIPVAHDRACCVPVASRVLEYPSVNPASHAILRVYKNIALPRHLGVSGPVGRSLQTPAVVAIANSPPRGARLLAPRQPRMDRNNSHFASISCRVGWYSVLLQLPGTHRPESTHRPSVFHCRTWQFSICCSFIVLAPCFPRAGIRRGSHKQPCNAKTCKPNSGRILRISPRGDRRGNWGDRGRGCEDRRATWTPGRSCYGPNSRLTHQNRVCCVPVGSVGIPTFRASAP